MHFDLLCLCYFVILVQTEYREFSSIAYYKNRCTREMYGRMIIITAWRSYASAVLGVVILSVCPSVCLSVRLSHACFVTNPKNLPAIFSYHILITPNMHTKTGFPSKTVNWSPSSPLSPISNSRRAVLSADADLLVLYWATVTSNVSPYATGPLSYPVSPVCP